MRKDDMQFCIPALRQALNRRSIRPVSRVRGCHRFRQARVEISFMGRRAKVGRQAPKLRPDKNFHLRLGHARSLPGTRFAVGQPVPSPQSLLGQHLGREIGSSVGKAVIG